MPVVDEGTLLTLLDEVSPIAIDLYDRIDQGSVLGLIATPYSLRDRSAMSGKFEWSGVYAELRKWVGDRQLQKVYGADLEYVVEPYEVTLPWHTELDNMERARISLADFAKGIARAFALGKIELAMRIIRNNALCSLDNANLIDTTHTHLDGSSYSNVVPVTRASAASPTQDELIAEIYKVITRLRANAMLQQTVTLETDPAATYVAIARSETIATRLTHIATIEELVANKKNELRGKFQVVRDWAPLAGTENTWDLIDARPGGVRPVIFGIRNEPTALEMDTKNIFNNRKIPVGMDGKYAPTAAFPQVIARATPV